jgi:hypothetical protein
MRPAVLPSAAYDVLKTSDGSGPPVLRQFDYRPTTGPDGSTAPDGWDLTWVESSSRTRLAEPALLAYVIDCSYPANHSRLIREHLQNRSGALTNPASTHLTEARVTFVTRPGNEHGALLLATQLCTLSNGQTVFIELATLEPVEDQWAYLSTLDRVTPRRAESLATAMRPLRVGPGRPNRRSGRAGRVSSRGFGGSVRPGQAGDLVPGGDELGDDVRTGMAGPASNENAHAAVLVSDGARSGGADALSRECRHRGRC